MFRGISQIFSGTLFGLTQPRISQIFHETVKKMSEVFVPLYIGSEAFQRHDIIHNHSPEWVKVLLPNAVAIIDSTYVGFARCKGKWSLFTPDSIYKGETQLSTAKANQTRYITRNFIGSVVNTDFIPIIDNNDALEHAQYMIRNIQLENEVVHMEANTTGWRKANTSDISSIITSYNENDVKQCSGEYSVRIAHAYLGHIQQQWSTYIHLDFPSTIKIKNIISRYKTTDNPKKHTVWIRFGHNKLHDIASYCTCKSSLRTAGGTCSHVIAALIALNYWKNNKKKASFYTTAAALFLNVLDCTTYKKSKMEQALEEYYGESSDTES
ncbi:unnamed protein product [Rotaria sordida]|uniref:SWIM-type domain-containing protein n=2 Tax=Rotaria sordida TaxID=392033 RepID=A0A819DYG3_9BILA|nr:unnamed protein product [Rotaria sordida]CAF3970118.1 unnamed protein product [Rotaria sordida]